MSGISGASSSAASASTVGNNLAPITFPGISSGIDYNSIINKLTALTLAPNTKYNNEITQINAKNAELIKINSMLASVQGTLSALSDPATFNAYTGTSTDSVDVNLSQLPNGNPAPGSYTIEATQVATTTTIVSPQAVGATVNLSTALISAGTAITPTNGKAGQQGLLTVDGVAINYDINSQSINTIVANIYASVHPMDAGFSISVNAGGLISIVSTDQQISLGSAADRGNLEQVLKLDVAQVDNSGPPNSVLSAGPIGGVNIGTALSAAGNAGFVSAVTSGQFTINGAPITVNSAKDNVANVLAKINSSTAGVIASFDMVTDSFTLANKATGAQSIVVGAAGDTSNFLTAAKLGPGAGSTTTIGKQAYVSVLTASGALHTTYSNSDAVANAITGMAVNVAGSTKTPFTVTVTQNPNVAIAAITNFVSAYNAALNEIAIATAAPIVQQRTSSTTASTTSSSSVLASGGALYGDQTVQSIRDRLTQLVSNLAFNGSTSYNSLASIGLALNTKHTVYQSNTNAYGGTVDATTSGKISSKTVDGTDGQLSPLDIAKFTAAFAAAPTTVAGLFTSASANGVSTGPSSTNGLSYQIGAYLTSITGEPTSLVSGLAGKIPIVSMLQADENAGTAEITALNKSIKSVTDKANAQADLLRRQATASEALVAKYQSEQSAVNQLNSSSSSS